MRGVCQEKGVDFLNITALANDEFDAGLHPNAQGHEKIYTQVRDFLIKNSWI